MSEYDLLASTPSEKQRAVLLGDLNELNHRALDEEEGTESRWVWLCVAVASLAASCEFFLMQSIASHNPSYAYFLLFSGFFFSALYFTVRTIVFYKYIVRELSRGPGGYYKTFTLTQLPLMPMFGIACLDVGFKLCIFLSVATLHPVMMFTTLTIIGPVAEVLTMKGPLCNTPFLVSTLFTIVGVGICVLPDSIVFAPCLFDYNDADDVGHMWSMLSVGLVLGLVSTVCKSRLYAKVQINDDLAQMVFSWFYVGIAFAAGPLAMALQGMTPGVLQESLVVNIGEGFSCLFWYSPVTPGEINSCNNGGKYGIWPAVVLVLLMWTATATSHHSARLVVAKSVHPRKQIQLQVALTLFLVSVSAYVWLPELCFSATVLAGALTTAAAVLGYGWLIPNAPEVFDLWQVLEDHERKEQEEREERRLRYENSKQNLNNSRVQY